MAKDARVARRPWCLSCITESLDADDVTMTRIEAVSHTPRADAWAGRPGSLPTGIGRTDSATISCNLENGRPRQSHQRPAD